jgi:hypothetical protein
VVFVQGRDVVPYTVVGIHKHVENPLGPSSVQEVKIKKKVRPKRSYLSTTLLQITRQKNESYVAMIYFMSSFIITEKLVP